MIQLEPLSVWEILALSAVFVMWTGGACLVAGALAGAVCGKVMINLRIRGSAWVGFGIGYAAGLLRSVSAERWLNDGPMSFWLGPMLFAAAAALVTWVFCYWWNIHRWRRYRASLREASLPE